MSLPKWTGAAGAYSRAYRILEKMAKTHTKPPKTAKRRGKTIIIESGWVSMQMRDFMSALDRGDEEEIKFFILKYLEYL
jgi:hypothetical protein